MILLLVGQLSMAVAADDDRPTAKRTAGEMVLFQAGRIVLCPARWRLGAGADSSLRLSPSARFFASLCQWRARRSMFI